MKTEHFECLFCHSKFVTEPRYLRHHCKQMKRAEESKSVEGQAAYSYYSKWMKAYQRMVPNHESFLSSKYYMSFMRFTTHAKKTRMPDTDVFIKLMKEKDISPTIWTNDQVYSLYLEYLDRRATPSQQAKITIKTLFNISDSVNCEVSDVFSFLEANELIELLRTRQVSPWLLLLSSKFREFLVNKTTPEQRIIMESIIRPQYWKAKFEKYPNDVALIKKYIEELNV